MPEKEPKRVDEELTDYLLDMFRELEDSEFFIIKKSIDAAMSTEVMRRHMKNLGEPKIWEPFK